MLKKIMIKLSNSQTQLRKLNLYNCRFVSFSKQTPGIFFDVDGVLKRGKEALPGAKETLIKLRDKGIPFTIITNAGGEPERKRVELLNKIIGLDSEEIKIKPDQLILCHTPMKGELRSYSDEKKVILITGIGDLHSVMEEYKVDNYITLDEYVDIFPEVVSEFLVRNKKKETDLRNKVENRLKTELRNFPKVSAIFMLTDVVRWELNVQIFCDLLNSSDGVHGTVRAMDCPQIVDFHVACMDLLYKDTFNLPRIGAGAFWFTLEHLFFMKYGRQINTHPMENPRI